MDSGHVYPFQKVKGAVRGFSSDDWALSMCCGHTISASGYDKAPVKYRCYKCKSSKRSRGAPAPFKDPRDGFEKKKYEKKISPHWRRP